MTAVTAMAYTTAIEALSIAVNTRPDASEDHANEQQTRSAATNRGSTAPKPGNASIAYLAAGHGGR